VEPDDLALSHDGRVMEVLSEHNCHGWLEGYTLTGRHGWFATYEAFAMVSASQTIQHSKWLEEARHLPWRETVPSLNILLTSDRMAQRPQRVLPPGPGPHPERHHPARRGEPRLSPTGRQLPAVGVGPRHAFALVREPRGHRQAATAAVAEHRRGDRAL
jgi:hypothetical protein